MREIEPSITGPSELRPLRAVARRARDRVDGRGAHRARVGLAVLRGALARVGPVGVGARHRRAVGVGLGGAVRHGLLRHRAGAGCGSVGRAAGGHACGTFPLRDPSGALSSPRSSADCRAAGAVCPRPQIDASCMTRARSSSRTSSDRGARPARSGPAPPPGARCRPGTARTARTTRRGRTPRCAAASPVRSAARVEHEHHARAERGPDLAGALEGERHVELVGQHEAARGPAEQDRAQLPAHAARQRQQLAQRGAERRPRTRPARRPRRRRRTASLPVDRPPPTSANAGPPIVEDLEHVVERLHVVDHRGLAEEAADRRERGLVARLAAEALDRVQQRGLLAADVGARAPAQLDVEREALAHDVGAEVAAGLRAAAIACSSLRVASGYSPRM